MFYVYIIYSEKLGKKYIGFSKDLHARIKKHNAGSTKSTAAGRPWKLVYYQCFLSEHDARNEEKFLKTGKGRERMKFLLEDTMKRI